jgi:hypothetical protein
MRVSVRSVLEMGGAVCEAIGDGKTEHHAGNKAGAICTV